MRLSPRPRSHEAATPQEQAELYKLKWIRSVNGAVRLGLHSTIKICKHSAPYWTWSRVISSSFTFQPGRESVYTRGPAWMSTVVNHTIYKPRNEKSSWLEGDALQAATAAGGPASRGGSICSLEMHQLASHSAFQPRQPASWPPSWALPGQTTRKQTPLHPGGVLWWPEVASLETGQNTRNSVRSFPKDLSGPIGINRYLLPSLGCSGSQVLLAQPEGQACVCSASSNRGPWILPAANHASQPLPPATTNFCCFQGRAFWGIRISFRAERCHPAQDILVRWLFSHYWHTM